MVSSLSGTLVYQANSHTRDPVYGYAWVGCHLLPPAAGLPSHLALAKAQIIICVQMQQDDGNTQLASAAAAVVAAPTPTKQQQLHHQQQQQMECEVCGGSTARAECPDDEHIEQRRCCSSSAPVLFIIYQILKLSSAHMHGLAQEEKWAENNVIYASLCHFI